MEKILVINTGGTFNKVYNPILGTLDIDTTDGALNSIAQHWLHHLNVENIIGKDSLEMTDDDRLEIYHSIQKHHHNKIIIVHGTDTMDQTALYLDNKIKDKTIVLTGAMVPYSINAIEATANFASAYGYLKSESKSGIYISMNGIIEDYKKVKKNKEKGYFEDSKQITFL